MLEELIMEIFEHCYQGQQPDLTFSIEYADDENNEISIYITYKAEAFNPFEYGGDDLDNLGMVLVSKIAKKQEHLFENGRNKIHICF
jgi:hypothetical protein